MQLNNLHSTGPIKVFTPDVNSKHQIVNASWISHEGTELTATNLITKAKDNFDLSTKVITSPAEVVSSLTIADHTNGYSSPSKLFPITDLSPLFLGSPVTLLAFQIYALNFPTGTTTIDDLLTNSLADSPNWAYNQARIMGGTLPYHEPNFFRPVLKMDLGKDAGGYDIYEDIISYYNTNEVSSSKRRESLLGIGAPMPLSIEANWRYNKIDDIAVYAKYYQQIDDAGTPKWIHYPVKADAVFLVEL